MADNDNRCAHKGCMCATAEDSDYCGPNCEAAEDQDIVEIACDCGHSGCAS